MILFRSMILFHIMGLRKSLDQRKSAGSFERWWPLLIRLDPRKSAVSFLSDHPITRSRRSPDSCAPLPASVSQSPTRHIRFVANTTQTGFRPGDDRAVKALFPLFSALTFAICHPQILITLRMSGRGSQKNDCTPPGGRHFCCKQKEKCYSTAL
jgi:hypothetical protein